MITPGNEGVYIDLHVQPKARLPGIRGTHDNRLKLAVSEPAESGKANQATIGAIAALLRVPTGAVTLVGGRTSRRKRVHIQGLRAADARRLIEAALDTQAGAS